MPMTAEKIVELRAAAESATRGPWRPGHLVDDDSSCNCGYIFGNDDRMGCVVEVRVNKGQPFGDEYPSKDEAKGNLSLLANCDPQTILALLDEVEALRAALAWIDNSDPEIVAAAEAKFGFSLTSPEGTK